MKDNFWQKIKKPILALAPMAGITDSPFRQVCKKFGADVVYSEMASAAALYFNPQKTLEMLKFKNKERPYIVQLFGADPHHFSAAAKIVAQKIKPDGLDINFGCPARKVTKIGAGAALMADLERSRQVIKAVRGSVPLPLSLKVRSKVGKVSVFELLQAISDLPISAIMVHGRSYEQGFSGKADWSVIKKVKENFKGVVLGNGGINFPEEVREMIERTGVDGVGIARGSLGRPWLFEQIKNYWQSGAYKEKNKKEAIKTALLHSRLAFQEKGGGGIIEMRKHLCWYVKNMPEARQLRKKLVQVTTLQEIEEIFKATFSS